MQRSDSFRATGVGLLFGFVMVSFLASGSIAETYKWKNSTGSVHFTDDISKIPEEFRHEAVPVKMGTAEASDPGSPPGTEKAGSSGSGRAAGAVQGDQECQFAIDQSISEYNRRFNENMYRLRGYYRSIRTEGQVARRKRLEQERDALLQRMDQDAADHEAGILREQVACNAGQGSASYRQCLTRLNSSRFQYTRAQETNMHRLRMYSKSIRNESSVTKRQQLEEERDALVLKLDEEATAKAEEFDRELEACEALRADN